MHYRLLTADEWPKLSSLMDPTFIPDPTTAYAAIAEDDTGVIRGVLFMQLTFHMEPLILTDPSVRFDRLYSTLHDTMARQYNLHGLHFYCFADKDVVAKMAAHVGMELKPYAVFEGKVE